MIDKNIKPNKKHDENENTEDEKKIDCKIPQNEKDVDGLEYICET